MGCTSLNEITVDSQNTHFASPDGVLLNKGQPTQKLIQFPASRSGSYGVPEGVTTIGTAAFAGSALTNVVLPESLVEIGEAAFSGCARLTNITIPENVRSIGADAFSDCPALSGMYFKGSPPTMTGSATSFSKAFFYYLPGVTGWESPLMGRPTVLWNPEILTNHEQFGVRDGKFGFAISGTEDILVVVEASTDLSNRVWTAVGTNKLTGGSSYFSDANWPNHSARFYRLRNP
jgi:hypothetical protein